VCRLRGCAPTLQPYGSTRPVQGTGRAERSGFGKAETLSEMRPATGVTERIMRSGTALPREFLNGVWRYGDERMRVGPRRLMWERAIRTKGDCRVGARNG